MAFEVVSRGRFEHKPALQCGECSIDRTGKLTLLAQDAEVVGIKSSAVILADAATFRIALRAPRAGEQEQGYSVRPILRGSRKPTGRCAVNISRAIRRCGLTPEAVAGRGAMTTKDDLLIIGLADLTTEKHKAGSNEHDADQRHKEGKR